MQKTERVGAVALLFLIVTIVAVALWDEGGASAVETAQAEPGKTAEPAGAQQQRAVRQRPQQAQRQQRDRHEDGLRSTRAAARLDDQSLLAGAGEVAPVRARPVQAPLLVEQSQPASKPVSPPEEATGEAGPATTLSQNGWGNGRKPRAEEVILAVQEAPPAPRERVVRKRKDQKDPTAGPMGTAASSGQTHVVKRSDTLGGIAQARLGRASRWPEIALLNGIEGHEIQVGQTLRLPGDASSPSVMTASAVTRVLPRARNASSPSTGRSYVIRKGDVLGTIAQHQLGSSTRWREILALNPRLDEKKLLVGTKILLPGGSRSSAAQKPLLASASTGSDYRVR